EYRHFGSRDRAGSLFPLIDFRPTRAGAPRGPSQRARRRSFDLLLCDGAAGSLAHVYERRVSRAVDAQLQYVRPSIVPGDIEAVLRLDDSFQIEIGIQDCLLVVYRTGQIVAVASG